MESSSKIVDLNENCSFSTIFRKILQLLNLNKIGLLSALELFHAYGKTDGR
jgi:hypothetical protein